MRTCANSEAVAGTLGLLLSVIGSSFVGEPSEEFSCSKRSG
jgi:hypothetical protein